MWQYGISKYIAKKHEKNISDKYLTWAGKMKN